MCINRLVGRSPVARRRAAYVSLQLGRTATAGRFLPCGFLQLLLLYSIWPYYDLRQLDIVHVRHRQALAGGGRGCRSEEALLPALLAKLP